MMWLLNVRVVVRVLLVEVTVVEVTVVVARVLQGQESLQDVLKVVVVMGAVRHVVSLVALRVVHNNNERYSLMFKRHKDLFFVPFLFGVSV